LNFRIISGKCKWQREKKNNNNIDDSNGVVEKGERYNVIGVIVVSYNTEEFKKVLFDILYMFQFFFVL